MTRLVRYLRWLCCVLTVAAVTLSFYLLLVVVALSIGTQPWNFPGDPPLFDMVWLPAGVSSVTSALVLAATRWAGGGMPPRRAGIASALLSGTLCMLCVAGIAQRHSPRWADVRNGIRTYGDAIAAAAGHRGMLSWEEFAALRARFLPTPVPVQLPGHGDVRLRMARRSYPYVGVDFGDGRNAQFDPATMVCIYAD